MVILNDGFMPSGEENGKIEMTVNQRIFHYRKLAGLTQAEVAERMGMKIPTYSKMEREGRITVDKLEKIAEILEININYLLKDTPKEVKRVYIPINPPEDDTTGNNTVEQPILSDKPFAIPPYVPTNRERNAMKIVHNLPKADQEEIYALIQKKFDESRNKG